MQHNKTLRRLFLADQKERDPKLLKRGPEYWQQMSEHDKQRRHIVTQILKNRSGKLTGRDYYMAAMIFQHGSTPADYQKAINLAKKAVLLGEEDARWLFAAATDRYLMKTGKKQKFGTQYRKKNGCWQLYPVDKRTSDRKRAEYDVPPLQKISAKAKELNRSGL